ncbi:MAG: SDR family oxidoreductase [Acidimicrobiia bacterium]|nr:SDR family oxidoreductase [Acidimicrobiia bacterium]
MDVAGRVALVTGGATRVGRAISLGLASAGADVFVHYNSSAGPADELVAEIESMGLNAAAGQAHLGDLDAAETLIDEVAAALGPPSILINSASGFPTDTITDVTPKDFRETIDVTLGAAVFLTKAMALTLPETTEGAVVNVSDVRTARPYHDHLSYILAKGGLDTFTLAAAASLAPRIRVNAVALGVILPPPGEDDDYVAELAAALPLERAGGTAPVVDAVMHLVQNHFITGEIVRINGGGHLV